MRPTGAAHHRRHRLNGSGTLVTQLFIQLGFVWFLLCGLLYGLTFLIGWKRGGVAAYRFKRNFSYVWLIGSLVLAAYGYFSGEMAAFVRGWGWGAMLDVVMLGLGWVGTMWWMATSYSNSRMLSDNESRLRELADQMGEDVNAGGEVR